MTVSNFLMERVNLESLCLKTVALIGMNGLAFYYDSQWVMVAMGANLITLGYSLRQATKKGEMIS